MSVRMHSCPVRSATTCPVSQKTFQTKKADILSAGRKNQMIISNVPQRDRRLRFCMNSAARMGYAQRGCRRARVLRVGCAYHGGRAGDTRSDDATGSIYWVAAAHIPSGGEVICAVTMPQGACIEGWLHISPPPWRARVRNPTACKFRMNCPSYDCASSRATAPDMTNQNSCT